MTQSTQGHSVVAIYDSHTGAESAIKALQQAGLDMQWEPDRCGGKGAYVTRHKAGGPSSSTSAGLVRRPRNSSTSSTLAAPQVVPSSSGCGLWGLAFGSFM